MKRVLLLVSFLCRTLLSTARDEVECATEDDLFFNMDITIDDFGGKCNSKDATTIGKMLQRVVNQVEDESLADLSIVVCPNPLNDDGRRARELADDGIHNRRLVNSNSFTYKCGGHFNHCGDNVRHLIDNRSIICEAARKAAYGSEIAAIAFKDAESAYVDLKEQVLECDDLQAGQRAVILTMKALQECSKERDAARAAATTAKQICNQVDALSAAESMALAQKASIDAMNAAEKTRSWMFAIETGLDETCGEVPTIRQEVSGQALYELTNMAIFGAEMTSVASDLTETAYLELRQRAFDCREVKMAEESVSFARNIVNEVQEAKIDAHKEADKATKELQRVTETSISRNDLSELIDEVGWASSVAINAATKAKGLYEYMIRDVLSGTICNPAAQHAQAAGNSPGKVCQMANEARFSADMITAALKSAEHGISDLMQDALQCNNLGSEKGILNAWEALRRCRKSKKVAASKVEQAEVQCERAKNASTQDLVDKYQQIAGKASRRAASEAKIAENSLAQIRNEQDKNICVRVPQLQYTDNSASTVCQIANSVAVGASLADAAMDQAEDTLGSLKERALDCYDLQHGQEYVDAAKSVMVSCRKSHQVTSKAAKRARKICKNARRASSKEELTRLVEAAMRLSESSKSSIEKTVSECGRLQDEFDGQFCTEIFDVGATEGQSDAQFLTLSPSVLALSEPPDIGVWLKNVAHLLYSKIPGEIQREYRDLKLGPDCIIKGFNVTIVIELLSPVVKRVFWITEESCSSINP